MKRALVLSALACTACAACSDSGIALAPIIEIPPETSTAYPYEGLEELELSIARAGDDAPLALATAALGEPLALSNVPFGDDLVVHLSGKAAGVEIAYGRTCAIAVRPDEPPVAPHLYFSRIVRWGVTRAAEPLAATRTGGNAYSLTHGSAVFAGGNTGVIEIFDPVHTGSFSTLQPLTMGRAGAMLMTFANGTGLLVGGVDSAGDAVPAIEVINPQAETPGRQLEEIPGPGLMAHAGALLVDGSIVIAGGETQTRPGDAFFVTDRAWRMQLGPGGVLDTVEPLAQRMQTGRSHHSMTRLGGELGADVLIVGGVDSTGAAVAEAELYRPLRETFEALASASLVHPRWDHAAVRMPGGFVLIVGGYSLDMNGEVQAEAEMELYDPVQGTFASAGVLPGNAGLVDMSVTPLPDGRVLLAGGRNVLGDPVATVLIARLDPLDGQVDISPTDSLDAPRAGHSAVSLCDGTILIEGGTSIVSVAERYNPPAAGRR